MPKEVAMRVTEIDKEGQQHLVAELDKGQSLDYLDHVDAQYEAYRRAHPEENLVPLPTGEKPCLRTEQMNVLPPEEKLLRAIFGESPDGPRYRSEVNGVTLKQAIETALSAFSPREIEIIRTRFGFNNPTERGRSLEETGKAFGLTRERIRQIEARYLRRLRHPSRSRQLKAYLD